MIDVKEFIRGRLEVELSNAPYFDTTFNVDAYISMLSNVRGCLDETTAHSPQTLVRFLWWHYGAIVGKEQIAARSKVIDILFKLSREMEKKESLNGNKD